MHAHLGHALREHWLAAYESCNDVAIGSWPALDAGKRALRSRWRWPTCFRATMNPPLACPGTILAGNQLTDRLGALNALARFADPVCNQDILADPRAGLRMSSSWTPGSTRGHRALADVDTIEARWHAEFSIRNPNRARALVFQFCLNNVAAIHTPEAMRLGPANFGPDPPNPEIAAFLTRRLDNWAQFAEPARSGMKDALETLRNHHTLSPNVSEIVDKALTIESE